MIIQEIQKLLKERKVYIGNNPELCRKIQRKLFEFGFGWYDPRNLVWSKEIEHLDAEFLFIYHDRSICWGSCVANYRDHRFKEIKPEKILEIQVTDLPPKYRIGQILEDATRTWRGVIFGIKWNSDISEYNYYARCILEGNNSELVFKESTCNIVKDNDAKIPGWIIEEGMEHWLYLREKPEREGIYWSTCHGEEPIELNDSELPKSIGKGFLGGGPVEVEIKICKK